MPSERVEIDEEVLKGLKSRQRAGENLSETIARLIDYERSTEDEGSSWKALGELREDLNLDDEEVEEVRRRSAQVRQDFDERIDRGLESQCNAEDP